MQDSIVYDVEDLKIYALTSEATPTYGAPVDAPFVNSIEITPNINESELLGDGIVADARARMRSLALTFAYGKLSAAVLALLDGGTVSNNAGATTRRYVRNGADRIPRFGIAARVTEVDAIGGAVKLYVYNCQVSGGTLFSAQMDEYGRPQFNAKAIPLKTAEQAMWGTDAEDVSAVLPASGANFAATRVALV